MTHFAVPIVFLVHLWYTMRLRVLQTTSAQLGNWMYLAQRVVRRSIRSSSPANLQLMIIHKCVPAQNLFHLPVGEPCKHAAY